ncbi:MAG: hypothetical protein U1E52_12940 [Geminicoccaceae bacterium]
MMVLTQMPSGAAIMPLVAAIPIEPAAKKKRGPKTPEGKARSRMNAVRHGLRARTFALLPGESTAEWAEHLAELRSCYGPVDAAEEKLVAAIAAAMWNEIRADRSLAETMARMPKGADLGEPGRARAMGTALRYMTAASMATQRAQRAFHAHRKAKQQGLVLPAAEPAQPMALEDRTNDLAASPAAEPAAAFCTNDFAQPSQPRPVPAEAPPLNRHQRRRLEALIRQARPRAA